MSDMTQIITITDAALEKVLEVRAGEPEPTTQALWVEISGVSGAAYTYDMEPDLMRVKAPTLILSDKGDTLVKMDEKAVRLRPDFKFRQFSEGKALSLVAEPQRWATLARLMAGGTGLVLLHQAMDFPLGADGAAVKGWLGAVFHSDIGSRGHWDMEFNEIAAHDVTRGVKPFAAPADGWLYNLHFAPAGVTPLLRGAVPDKSRSTADSRKHAGRAEVIAWAHQRPEGGRGFGFTGADIHRSWTYPSQRTLVLNGILWSAGLPVPTGGVQVDLDPAALERNLDDKPAPAPAKAKAKAPAAKKSP